MITSCARHASRHSRRRWIERLPVLSGIAAALWLVLRSGPKPSRLSYPCQRAAISTASLAFGAGAVALLASIARRLRAGRRVALWGAAAALCGLVAFGSWSLIGEADTLPADPAFGPPPAAWPLPARDPLPPTAPVEYRATVYHAQHCAQVPVGDHFPGLDDLLEIMGARGLKFYQSDVVSLTSGPAGIVGAADTVVIKINYQWDQRGGTNTDLLRGLVRRIVDHPDGFTGEVVIAENAQFASTSGLDRAENNAQDHHLSPHDVVLAFKALGYRVSQYDWTNIQYTQVQEYAAGNLNDGYVVGSYDASLGGRVSYPKFTTDYGTRISLRRGTWTSSGGYDKAHLKFINVPVLKSHHSTYGTTASVKHYMGVVTSNLNTNSHNAIANGILGALLGQIEPADLNLLDCIWINANPYTGPSTSYDGATRRDELVASLDPVALDIWADKNILIPAFIANGYSPPWPYPSADPDDPNSAFRHYLDNSMLRIQNAGYSVTNDLARIDVIDQAPPGEPSDPGGAGAPFTITRVAGGYELHWSIPVRGGPVTTYVLYRTALGGAPRAVPECEAPLGTDTSALLPDLTADAGFLVVARNAAGDGSFGSDSLGHERPSPAAGASCP